MKPEYDITGAKEGKKMDPRNYQMLAYMTADPAQAKHVLGVTGPDHRDPGTLRVLLAHLGRGMTATGHWMLRQAGQPHPAAERVRETTLQEAHRA